MLRFADRADAGRRLAPLLADYADDARAVALALPRGGVPVAYEVARLLHIPLDVYVVRKLGVPRHEELAMGALAPDGSTVVDQEVIAFARVSPEAFERTLERERTELRRRERVYRDDRPAPVVEGKIAIVVDDGLATGASVAAAVGALRAQRPARIVVAVPVAAEESLRAVARIADRVVCVGIERRFGAVGRYYENFGDVSDDEVRRLLGAAEREYREWMVTV